MYQVFFNGKPLYDPRGAELGLLIRDPDCQIGRAHV